MYRVTLKVAKCCAIVNVFIGKKARLSNRLVYARILASFIYLFKWGTILARVLWVISYSRARMSMVRSGLDPVPARRSQEKHSRDEARTLHTLGPIWFPNLIYISNVMIIKQTLLPDWPHFTTVLQGYDRIRK